jgi:hypothetical protein
MREDGMFERSTTAERIELAKAKMTKVLDHFLYVVELHANNAFVVYSPTLVSQIPRSFAANAFNVFQRSMHQIEIVRMCALWDTADPDKENIPTVVELIDSEQIIDALAAQTRSHWTDNGGHLLNPSDDLETAALEQEAVRASNNQFGNDQALKAKTELMQAIEGSRSILSSQRLASVMNLRDKHLAHSLTTTRREKRAAVPPMKLGDETELLNREFFDPIEIDGKTRSRCAMPLNTSPNCPRPNTMPTSGKPRWKRCCWSRN